jgi:hypothetical protein
LQISGSSDHRITRSPDHPINEKLLDSQKNMKIEIIKQPDGTGVLRCTRRDGSVTWQKQRRHAAHFALHDLTHYAVETALAYQHGFFGLIAAGWDIEDTTGKGRRGALPAQALEVESIVGLFDSERASGALWTAEDFNQNAPRRLSEADIQSVRRLRGELFEKWSNVAPGEKLELEFDSERAPSELLHESS